MKKNTKKYKNIKKYWYTHEKGVVQPKLHFSNRSDREVRAGSCKNTKKGEKYKNIRNKKLSLEKNSLKRGCSINTTLQSHIRAESSLLFKGGYCKCSYSWIWPVGHEKVWQCNGRGWSFWGQNLAPFLRGPHWGSEFVFSSSRNRENVLWID